MKCYECGEMVFGGVILNGAPLHYDCVDLYEMPSDTPSLQDRDPEGWGAAHNVNPWGMEGGY